MVTWAVTVMSPDWMGVEADSLGASGFHYKVVVPVVHDRRVSLADIAVLVPVMVTLSAAATVSASARAFVTALVSAWFRSARALCVGEHELDRVYPGLHRH